MEILNSLKQIAIYMLLSTSLIFGYIELSHSWVDCGGISGKIFLFEVPILLSILLFLYTPFIDIKKNIILSLIPIFGLYVLYDVFYYYLAKSPSMSDLQNIGVLSDFSLSMLVGLLLVVSTVVIVIIYLLFAGCRRNTKHCSTVLLVKIIILSIMFYTIPSLYLKDKLVKSYHVVGFSQGRTIRKNGRFTSFVYYGIIRNRAKDLLKDYKDKSIDVNKLLFSDVSISKKRNIYIVVLESFLDPRLLMEIELSRDPLSSNLKKYLHDGKFSSVLSPVYGGGTAQAEFEVLTGVKAFALVNSVEFNSLQGKQISGFIDALKDQGYSSYALIASNSNYYNSKDAYKSIGFDEIIFLEEKDNFQLQENDNRIFDGDVYQYQIKEMDQKHFQGPYIHYILGMYGHMRYERNLVERPDVIEVKGMPSSIQRITNQFYYRTKALGKYIDELLKRDPHALIYITSDHLPPVLSGDLKYAKTNRTNIALLIDNGEKVKLEDVFYYDVSKVLMQRLTENNSSINHLGNTLQKEMYFKVMSESFVD